VSAASRKDRRKRRRSIHYGRAWAPVFLPLVPLFLLAGALSVPYSKWRRYVIERREREFADQMRICGRTMTWSSFIREMDEEAGTLILESASMKGPYRLWWTSETPATESSELEASLGEVDLEVVTELWAAKDTTIRQRFTSLNGSALLIIGTIEDKRSALENGRLPERWRRVHVGPSADRLLAEFPEAPSVPNASDAKS
jgi:hypothetical protein